MIALAWKLLGSPLAGRLGAGLSVVLALVCLGQAVSYSALQRTTEREIARLTDAITRPVTGYAARLAQCRTETETVRSGLNAQNAALAAKSAADVAALKRAETALAAERGRVAELTRRADQILTYRAAGATSCERMEDVRRRYLEALK